MNKTHALTMFFLAILLPAVTWQITGPTETLPHVRKRIAFDETHGEIQKISDAYSAFCIFLQSSGFDVEPLLEGPLTLNKLRVYSTVVLALPTKLFSHDEIESLVRYVEGGGGLFILGDSGNDLFWGSNIDNVSRRFDVSFNRDMIRAPQEPILIEHFEDHPVTAGVSKIVCRSGSSLTINGTATRLAWLNDEAWADKYVGKVGVFESGETKGREAIVMAASEYGLGRVVCLGSSTLFLEANLNSDHKKLGYNILKWLSSVEPVKTSIQNGLIRLKFLDDSLHSSYQIDVWDNSMRNWTTAYHDVRFYTTCVDGFNVTWNMGNCTVETKTIGDYEFLVVKYPEAKQYGYESVVVDVGSSDDKYVIGKGWSNAFEYDNRTVRQVEAGSEDVHILIDYPDHPWLQHTLKITYLDSGQGRKDLNMLTSNGWITLKSFYTSGEKSWKEINVTFDPANLYADPGFPKLRFGIHAEGDPLIVDEVSFASFEQSGSLEVKAAVKKDSPFIHFYVKTGDLELNSIGIIGELATETTQGKRFAFSSILKDAYFEKNHELMLSQGTFQTELILGTGEDLFTAPTLSKSFYLYGEGWSESFVTENGTKAREIVANRTNTFIVIPVQSPLNMVYNLSFTYLDAGVATADINIFNGTGWVGIGYVKRNNTGTWRTATFPIPSSELYFDAITGGAKLGLFAHEDNLVVSKIKYSASTIGEEEIAVAFSTKKDDIVNFIVVPNATHSIIQHEVDGPQGVVKTIDISTCKTLEKEQFLPIASVGSVTMETSNLLKEAEEVIANGWRPQPVNLAPIYASGDLAVARLNGSELSFQTLFAVSGKYRIFIRYYDLSEGFFDKEILVSINGREEGKITYEGTNSYRLWSKDIDLVEGINTVTLTPLSKVPSSELAYVDYILFAPKIWEEEACYELTQEIPQLLGD